MDLELGFEFSLSHLEAGEQSLLRLAYLVNIAKEVQHGERAHIREQATEFGNADNFFEAVTER